MTKTKKTLKTKDRFLMDVKGDLIPVSYLDKNVVKEHDLVEFLLSEANTLNCLLSEFKARSTKAICKHLSDTAEKYGEKWKGNALLYNYSRDKAVEYSIANFMDFDNKLEIAKTKIYNCIERWTEGINENVTTLVKAAFDTDKRGLVDTKRILGLTRLKLKDPEWKEAMEIIRDSITLSTTKKYINFRIREAEDKAFKTVTLNYSSL